MGDIKEARESVDGAVGSVEEHVTLEQQVYKQLFEDKWQWSPLDSLEYKCDIRNNFHQNQGISKCVLFIQENAGSVEI